MRTCPTMRGMSALHVVKSAIAYVCTFFKLCMHIAGSIRTHPSTSPHIGPRRRRHGRRYESKTLDDSINRLRTGVGRYRAAMKKWGLADSAACECGEPEQTAEHIINSCQLHRPPSEAGLFEVGPLTRAWLQLTELTI